MCVFLPKITLSPDESEDVIKFKRKQFPIRLAFSLTINKAQGQSIKKLGIFIDSPLFSHGHLYTSMSRVTNKTFMKVLVEKKTTKTHQVIL